VLGRYIMLPVLLVPKLSEGGDAILLPVLSVPNLSEGGGSVGGQLRGDEECPFRGVTGCGSFGESAGR